MFNETEDNAKYHGIRGQQFKDLIHSVLEKSKMKKKYIDALLSESSLQKYSIAFTTALYNPTDNYEYYEQLGDISANTFIVWYFHRRFPSLNNNEGVSTVARLRINYGSKASFFPIADNLGFWPFISSTVFEREKERKNLLEDTFEAFLGCTQQLLDDMFIYGVGYSVIYDILSNIFDNQFPIVSLKYEDLYDAKTRLKEIFDYYVKMGHSLGNLVYKNNKTIVNGFNLNETKVFQDYNGTMILLGVANAAIQPDSQQKAAQLAIDTLFKKNIYKKMI